MYVCIYIYFYLFINIRMFMYLYKYSTISNITICSHICMIIDNVIDVK